MAFERLEDIAILVFQKVRQHLLGRPAHLGPFTAQSIEILSVLAQAHLDLGARARRRTRKLAQK